MKFDLALLLVSTIFFLTVPSFAAEHAQLKAFPQAQENMERFVIELPHKERSEETDFMVELIAGKTMLTDGVNTLILGSSIEPRPLKGWGYTYYEVTGKPITTGTLMAVPEGTPKISKFVSGKPLKIRYNSRLPIVIYAPEGLEIQYRIWQASTATEKGKQG